MIITKHYVTFLSPGTFVAEQTTKEISSWDIDKVIEMSLDIKERHAAIPYGFYFSTRERGEEDFDSKEIKRSNTYFLGGKISTLEEVEQRGNPDDRILIQNMKSNDWDQIIENNNSWKWVQPFKKGDILINWSK